MKAVANSGVSRFTIGTEASPAMIRPARNTVVNLVALFLLLVPGVNLIAFYAGNGYLSGARIFRDGGHAASPPEEARRLRKANMGHRVLCGLIIAGLASVPILNLLTPLFATAFMVHVYKSLARRAGLSRLSPRPA